MKNALIDNDFSYQQLTDDASEVLDKPQQTVCRPVKALEMKHCGEQEGGNMEFCYRHPDREGVYFCQKDGTRMCEECACCHSPNIYCQFRTACIINMLTKEGELASCAEKARSKKTA